MFFYNRKYIKIVAGVTERDKGDKSPVLLREKPQKSFCKY